MSHNRYQSFVKKLLFLLFPFLKWEFDSMSARISHLEHQLDFTNANVKLIFGPKDMPVYKIKEEVSSNQSDHNHTVFPITPRKPVPLRPRKPKSTFYDYDPSSD